MTPHVRLALVLLAFWAVIGPLAGYAIGHLIGYRNGFLDAYQEWTDGQGTKAHTGI